MSPHELPLLYRDAQLVVIHKPAGLLTHRSGLAPHETRFALQLLRRQLRQRVWPVHRLDKPASGALLFALDARTAAVLSGRIRRHELERTYLAVVRGRLPDSGVIDHPLPRRLDPAETGPRDAARSAMDARAALGAPLGAASPPRAVRQAAITRFSTLGWTELPHRVDRYPTSRYSLLRLSPLTGRRHQLRRHLAHVSHPIVGDTTYGKARHNHLFETLFASRRLLLACVELRFAQPLTGEPLVVPAPLAPEFAAVVQALGWTEAVPSRWQARRYPT